MLLPSIPLKGKITFWYTAFDVFHTLPLVGLSRWECLECLLDPLVVAFAFLLALAFGLTGYWRHRYQKLYQQQARQQQGRHEQEQYYSQLLLGMREGLFIHGYQQNGLPSTFREVNLAACQLLGYSEKELLTLSPLEIDAPEQQGKIRQVSQQVADNAFALFETLVRTKNGTLLPVEIHVSRLHLSGEILVISLVRDISARRQAEAERSVLMSELTHKNRSLEHFTRLTSHNLRAPVANMLGLLSLYNHQDLNDRFNLEVVENVEKAVRNLDHVLTDLNELLLARTPLLERRQRVSFAPVLEAVTSSISAQLQGSGGKLTVDFSAAPQVETIESYLHSVLLNLLTNAIKYRSPDRTLSIQIDTCVCSASICLSVSDNGLGMDLSNMGDKLFGLYNRFHPQIEGKGLGLYLVKTQVEELGGKLEVESQLRVGTTFRVYFPC